jgi:putative two-component system response regulator
MRHVEHVGPSDGSKPADGMAVLEGAVKERLLVVDGDLRIRSRLDRILCHAGYRCATARTAARARARFAEGEFDLILCDVRLPGSGSGLDLVEHVLAQHPHTAAVMVSGRDDIALADRALTIGACGYLIKPFDADDVLRSVASAISRREHDRAVEQELRASREETVQRLCIAVEARDPGMAAHIGEMSDYCRDAARQLGLPADRCDLIRAASAMHDIGKIGIPDDILLKPGTLTADERASMQEHPEIGHRILAGSRSELLQLAAVIAWTHHEKFDGSGYPRGLAGDQIPLEGRLAAVADVYDALTRDRVYRPRFARGDALELLECGRGTHFDPDILDALLVALRRPAGA